MKAGSILTPAQFFIFREKTKKGRKKETMIIAPSAFRLLGWDMLHHIPINSPINRTTSSTIEARREAEFRSAFGVSSAVCSHTWEYLSSSHEKVKGQTKAKPTHQLWALMFLKTYDTEIFLCSLLSTSERTFRKWVWIMIEAISNLYDDLVSFLIFCYPLSQVTD